MGNIKFNKKITTPSLVVSLENGNEVDLAKQAKTTLSSLGFDYGTQSVVVTGDETLSLPGTVENFKIDKIELGWSFGASGSHIGNMYPNKITNKLNQTLISFSPFTLEQCTPGNYIYFTDNSAYLHEGFYYMTSWDEEHYVTEYGMGYYVGRLDTPKVTKLGEIDYTKILENDALNFNSSYSYEDLVNINYNDASSLWYIPIKTHCSYTGLAEKVDEGANKKFGNINSEIKNINSKIETLTTQQNNTASSLNSVIHYKGEFTALPDPTTWTSTEADAFNFIHGDIIRIKPETETLDGLGQQFGTYANAFFDFGKAPQKVSATTARFIEDYLISSKSNTCGIWELTYLDYTPSPGRVHKSRIKVHFKSNGQEFNEISLMSGIDSTEPVTYYKMDGTPVIVCTMDSESYENHWTDPAYSTIEVLSEVEPCFEPGYALLQEHAVQKTFVLKAGTRLVTATNTSYWYNNGWPTSSEFSSGYCRCEVPSGTFAVQDTWGNVYDIHYASFEYDTIYMETNSASTYSINMGRTNSSYSNSALSINLIKDYELSKDSTSNFDQLLYYFVLRQTHPTTISREADGSATISGTYQIDDLGVDGLSQDYDLHGKTLYVDLTAYTGDFYCESGYDGEATGLVVGTKQFMGFKLDGFGHLNGICYNKLVGKEFMWTGESPDYWEELGSGLGAGYGDSLKQIQTGLIASIADTENKLSSKLNTVDEMVQDLQENALVKVGSLKLLPQNAPIYSIYNGGDEENPIWIRENERYIGGLGADLPVRAYNCFLLKLEGDFVTADGEYHSFSSTTGEAIINLLNKSKEVIIEVKRPTYDGSPTSEYYSNHFYTVLARDTINTRSFNGRFDYHSDDQSLFYQTGDTLMVWPPNIKAQEIGCAMHYFDDPEAPGWHYGPMAVWLQLSDAICRALENAGTGWSRSDTPDDGIWMAESLGVCIEITGYGEKESK